LENSREKGGEDVLWNGREEWGLPRKMELNGEKEQDASEPVRLPPVKLPTEHTGTRVPATRGEKQRRSRWGVS